MRRRLAWVASVTLAAASAALVLAGAYHPAQSPAIVGSAAAVVAALLAAAMAALAAVRPWSGLLLLLAAMPIVNVGRADLPIGPIQILPGTLVIASLAVGTALQRPQGLAASPGRVTWILLGLAAALAIASSAISTSRAEAGNITLHGVLEPLALLAVVLAQRPATRQVLQALLALALGVVIASAINVAWLWLLVADGDLYRQRMLFARLTYYNVGIFATVLVMAIPAAAAPLFLRLRDRWARAATTAGWAALALFVVALFFTYTKSAWLSAAIVAALLVILLVGTWRRRVPLLLAIAVLLAAVVPYPLPLLRVAAPQTADGYEAFLIATQGPGRVDSWDPDTYNGSGSISIRLESVGAAAQIAAGAPLLGVGPGGFQPEFARIRPDADVPELQSAHNLLPNLAAEYGVPFALLAAIGLFWLIWRCLGLRRELEASLRVAGVTVAVALIGFLAMATMFGNDLYRAYRMTNADILTVAVLAGLGGSLVRLRSAGSGPRAEARQPIDQPAQLGAAGRHEGERSGS